MKNNSKLTGGSVSSRMGWYYLLVRQGCILDLEKRFRKRFETYRYRGTMEETVGLRTMDKRVPTLRSTLFVHGVIDEIIGYMADFCPYSHLESDCATGQPAFISEREMADFITVAESNRPIRLMLKGEEYYWLGNNRMRVVSGCLEGMEGYVIRLNKDRKLIMRMGDKMVAIGVNSDEQFQSMDDYAELIETGTAVSDLPSISSVVSRTLEEGFIRPESLLEVVTMSLKCRKVVAYVRLLLSAGHARDAGVLGSLLVGMVAAHMASYLAGIASDELARCYEKDMRKLIKDLVGFFKNMACFDGHIACAQELEQLSDQIRLSPHLRGLL